ncbi:MAG: EAL domain-containing protein [Desulfovibrionaceae bacterium]|nr:EAL domain-containing protein [Desulfovibrionaceae bacterium]
MQKRMNDSELLDAFEGALRTDALFPLYQPQINHNTKHMVGAEVLMRWKDPEFGMQYPSDFIPVLEKNDLIFRADLHIFELGCRFLKKCSEQDIHLVPLSFNMSRYDIYNHTYVDALEAIRKKYDVPVKLLRIELTESSAIGGLALVTAAIEKLHSYGYIVEMDDFGSGYSSLNILKDLNVDVIKLDMKFFDGTIGGRGGIIIGAVVQMARWLEIPLIAEGVENMEQADYMKSIGCYYIQGYLYSKPLPEETFIDMLQRTSHEPLKPAMNLISTMDAGKFWNPQSMETLIFNNFVGAAAIFTYEENGSAVLLRVNEKYLRELGMNLSEKEIVGHDVMAGQDEHNKKIYTDTIRRAIASRDEETCETWRAIHSDCCGDDEICLRTDMRVIGVAGNQYLLYAMVQNITAEKRNFMVLEQSERRFRFASEQANVYAWEYIVATRQMRPCFRCMRDLGLPAVLENYPEPAIAMGIFPPDYADMYRDWHRQIAQGVKSLEAIMPLTVGRIPFHVRYTTEFSESGKPVKAYGSATLVIEESQKT